ncbi:MAG: nuclear transport factor 2 family protein [Pseudomonadota bacterium]|uniref:nuclear transport factor 2 family protein n=1 Tax=Hyphomonas sp. BRH_c22 TaxID=1629710 RepID=UPI000B152CB2|nr:nuclear transport factor 2 family protein [Hyphomonas sp. BRH_c22]
MKHLLAALVLILPMTACATPQTVPVPILTPAQVDAESARITALLEAQDAAWNRGDIDAFMKGYWRSPELRFASGGNVTRGWDETNARYKRVYATPDLMGRLSTSDYEIVILSPDAAIAHGAWRLDRPGDRPSGLYTLVMRKIGGEWLIVSDTTTSAG